MKKLFFAIPVLLLLLSGCNQLDKLTQFNMVFDETVTIPSATGVDLPADTKIPDIETNSESTFSAHNTHKDLIEEVVLKESKLTITAPGNGDFTFLKSITIYMSADSLEEVKVAWQDTIPANSGNTLTLKTTNVNLKEFILKDSFSFRVNTVIQKVITSDYSIDMHTVFFVDAKILGI
jgi:hypothetical protein